MTDSAKTFGEIVNEKLARTSGSLATRIDCRLDYGREACGANAHRHRRNVGDSTSCKVPPGQTITLEEWRAQQAEGT